MKSPSVEQPDVKPDRSSIAWKNSARMSMAFAALICVIAPVLAQDWKPSRNTEFVVGAGSGGGNDRTARVIQKILQERALIPTPMVVVNRPGAGGVIAQDYLNTHQGDG